MCTVVVVVVVFIWGIPLIEGCGDDLILTPTWKLLLLLLFPRQKNNFPSDLFKAVDQYLEHIDFETRCQHAAKCFDNLWSLLVL